MLKQKIMKQYKISAVFTVLLLAVCSVLFTACSEDLSTDQYGNDISLNSFGPSPVLRGGVLTFKGSNLDQIVEIDLPGADPITNINVVQSGKHSEINIEVPKEKCEPGIVVLKTAKGGEIKTLTPITYLETIKLNNFFVGSEGNLTGSVGDEVTINGDYLNNIHAVVFADGVTVKDSLFTEHTRYQIKVAIPKQARTGRIQLSDEAATGANYLYSDATLNVNLPTASGVSPEKVKAGQTVSVSGTDLGQIASVELSGATVDSAAVNRAVDGKTLTFALPAEATDGEVTLITYSDVKIPVGTITTVVPTNLAASPGTVKNGAELKITGNDLDLVTKVIFPNVTDAVAINSQSSSAIVVTVPQTAQSGDIELGLANGKIVKVGYKLVEPTVTGFTPASITAGETVVIKGTNLDLVASVTFPTNHTVQAADFKAQTAGAIGVVVPAAASGSGVVLTLKNGTTITAQGLTIVASTNPTMTNSPTGTAGSNVTIEGSNYNNVENVLIGQAKVTNFIDRSATKMTFTIPGDLAAGTYDVVMKTYDGQSFTVGKLVVEPKEIDLSASGNILTEDRKAKKVFPVTLAWSSEGQFRIMRDTPIDLSKYTWTAGKSVLKFYKQTDSKGQIQVNDGVWKQFEMSADWSGTESVLEVKLTQDMIDWITGAKNDGWSQTAFLIQGDGIVVTKVTLVP